jgi:hypothetical protein
VTAVLDATRRQVALAHGEMAALRRARERDDGLIRSLQAALAAATAAAARPIVKTVTRDRTASHHAPIGRSSAGDLVDAGGRRGAVDVVVVRHAGRQHGHGAAATYDDGDGGDAGARDGRSHGAHGDEDAGWYDYEAAALPPGREDAGQAGDARLPSEGT